MPIHIRRATNDDLPALLEFVRELAVYEKEPEAVTATLRDYEEAFSEGIFQAQVAEIDKMIVGITIYYITWSTWKGKMLYLEDFIVKEAYRKHGIGQLLFDAFIEEAKRRNCRLVKWQVLEWNSPAVNFYKKNEAVIEKDWWNGKIIF